MGRGIGMYELFSKLLETFKPAITIFGAMITYLIFPQVLAGLSKRLV
jgi:hypothetical protein